VKSLILSGILPNFGNYRTTIDNIDNVRFMNCGSKVVCVYNKDGDYFIGSFERNRWPNFCEDIYYSLNGTLRLWEMFYGKQSVIFSGNLGRFFVKTIYDGYIDIVACGKHTTVPFFYKNDAQEKYYVPTFLNRKGTMIIGGAEFGYSGALMTKVPSIDPTTSFIYNNICNCNFVYNIYIRFIGCTNCMIDINYFIRGCIPYKFRNSFVINGQQKNVVTTYVYTSSSHIS
jgi:hypothetical protein